MTVRTALSTDAAKVRSIDPGDTIVVMETGVHNGHQRGRIGESEWVSLVTAKGKVLATLMPTMDHQQMMPQQQPGLYAQPVQAQPMMQQQPMYQQQPGMMQQQPGMQQQQPQMMQQPQVQMMQNTNVVVMGGGAPTKYIGCATHCVASCFWPICCCPIDTLPAGYEAYCGAKSCLCGVCCLYWPVICCPIDIRPAGGAGHMVQ